MTRRALAGAAALVAVAAVLVVLGTRPRHPGVGANVFVNPAGIIDAFSTPTLVRDPARPADLVAVYRQDRPRFSSQVASSTDGGSSWRTAPLPLPPGTHEAFFPDAAFAPDGSLYVVFVDLEGAGNVPADLLLVHSTDLGRTFSAPVRVTGADAFQPRIVVGRDGTLVLTWLQVMAAPGARLAGASVRVLATTSGDGGRTFSPPLGVSPAGADVSSPVPALGPSGELIVAYHQLPGATLANRGTDRSQLVVSRAARSGAEFTAPVVVDRQVISHQPSDLFDNLFPSLASSLGGTLYLAWSDRRAGGEQVLLSQSVDGGARWSIPASVAQDQVTSTGATRFLPAVDVAPNGRLDIAFLAMRSAPFADLFLATSSNRGGTFEVTRLSSASFDSQVGPNFGQGLPADLSSHLGLVSRDDGLEAAWADSRLGTTTTGRQDIVTAHVTVSASSALARPETVAGIVAAAAALALLVAAGRGRRGHFDRQA